MAVYHINKGINKPIEFKGLKAQYIGYLAAGLVALLIFFAVMYISGLPVYICLLVISVLGGGLFYQVFRLSHKYGQHGLMKRSSARYLPGYLKFNSRKLFTRLKR
jgi:4-hydroxybenzoate polyprenyltransferase